MALVRLRGSTALLTAGEFAIVRLTTANSIRYLNKFDKWKVSDLVTTSLSAVKLESAGLQARESRTWRLTRSHARASITSARGAAVLVAVVPLPAYRPGRVGALGNSWKNLQTAKFCALRHAWSLSSNQANLRGAPHPGPALNRHRHFSVTVLLLCCKSSFARSRELIPLGATSRFVTAFAGGDAQTYVALRLMQLSVMPIAAVQAIPAKCHGERRGPAW